MLPTTNHDRPRRPSRAPGSTPPRDPSSSGLRWLLAVAVGFGVAQAVAVTLGMYLSWDEALYASQFSPSVPAMELSAHRALGASLLLAPVTVVTPSVTAIRAYLAVATSVGLVIAYRPWLAIGGRTAVLAAALFAGSEVALVNAPQALPSMPAALASVAGVGFFLQANGSRRTRGALVGVAVAFTVLTLVRPTDAVFVAAPTLLAAVLVRRWRRLAPAAAVVVGLLLGGVVWVVEAWVRFDGPLSRLAAMRRITATGGTPVLSQWIAAVRGHAAEAPWPTALVTAACVAAATLAAVVLVRRLRAAPWSSIWVLPVVVALVVGLPYLLLSFTSNRYLLPAYGLVALALAAVLVGLTRVWSGRTGKLVSCVVAAVVAGYVVVQVPIARIDAGAVAVARLKRQGYAASLSRLGVVPPCVVSGSYAPQLAYALKCFAGDIQSAAGDDATEEAANRRDMLKAHDEHAQLVIVRSSARRPAWLTGWTRVRLSTHSPVYAYFLRAPG